MRSNLFLVVELACDDIAFDSEGMDYTLQQIVDLLHTQGHLSAVATADAVILEGEPFPMDASYWKEAGHQYSSHKQWWPMPDRI